MAMDVGGNKRGPRADINVTPLVDVVLVLLIIFMVVLPSMTDEGKPIEMVKVESADEIDPNAPEPLVVTIDVHETYVLDDADMSREQVLASLRRTHAAEPKRRVLLRGDALLPYEVMRSMFHDIQQIGFPGVALAVGVAREWKPEEGG